MILDSKEYLMEPLCAINVMELAGEDLGGLMELLVDLGTVAEEYGAAYKMVKRLIKSLQDEEQIEMDFSCLD